MKKLKPKDLMLSPRVVTDLTGNGNSDRDVSNHCPVTFPDCNTSAQPGGCNTGNDQCLSEVENPCASDDNCTGETCLLTGDNTCNCTVVCPETQSDNELCCEPSDDINTKCCITPPVSIEICQESEVEMCPETKECPESVYC